MNISKRWKEYAVGVIIGILGNAGWALIRDIPVPPVHVFTASLIRGLFFIAFALMCIFIGRKFGASTTTASNAFGLVSRKVPLSTIFVLEVSGSQPLDSANCDWRFFLTNCTNRMLRHVELSNVKSDLGASELAFREIPVIKPGEKMQLFYELRSRRMTDRNAGRRPTLWEFATDITGEGRSSYIWYTIHVQYREVESEAIRDGDFVAVCFDLAERKMKTEEAEHYLNERFRTWEL